MRSRESGCAVNCNRDAKAPDNGDLKDARLRSSGNGCSHAATAKENYEKRANEFSYERSLKGFHVAYLCAWLAFHLIASSICIGREDRFDFIPDASEDGQDFFFTACGMGGVIKWVVVAIQLTWK